MGFSIGKLFSGVTNFITGTPNIPDMNAPFFYAKTISQSGYDREIDEGMSSGMRRYMTIDASAQSEAQTAGMIGDLVRAAEGFNLTKQMQVGGFNKGGKRYVIVSGESHAFFQGAAADSYAQRAAGALGKDAKLVDYVAPPSAASLDRYEPVNLGPYGTTGNPMLGIAPHKKAAELRAQGKIE